MNLIAPEVPVGLDRGPEPAWRRTLRSFRFASAGVWLLIRSEPNARVQLALGVLAVVLGLWLGLAPLEWAVLVLVIGLVLATEALNTALEEAIDLFTRARHPQAGAAKDLAAAGVLLASVSALAVGAILFVPKLLQRL